MKLQEVINAWNAQADEYNQWDMLSSDEMAEFVLKYVEEKARSSLAELEAAIYSPQTSGISVKHAINHVKQIFSV